jgi:dipeptidyl aminopeptidase/acylaminoacyl peptidase
MLVIDVAAKKLLHKVQLGDKAFVGQPKFSPDGKWIAFSYGKSPEVNDNVYSDISMIEVETGQTKTIANTGAGETNPQFSPDGKYLFVQDSAGVMLFSRNPLQLKGYIDSALSYPVQFSADSQSLTLLTWDLFLTRWRVADGKQVDLPHLVIPGGCLYATLSPGGELIACETPELDLAIYRVDDGKKLFAASVHSFPKGFVEVPVPFDSTTDFSAPFGFFLSNSLKQFANRGLVRHPTWFSLDGKFLISGNDCSCTADRTARAAWMRNYRTLIREAMIYSESSPRR